MKFEIVSTISFFFFFYNRYRRWSFFLIIVKQHVNDEIFVRSLITIIDDRFSLFIVFDHPPFEKIRKMFNVTVILPRTWDFQARM